jgi:hypothetical protein
VLWIAVSGEAATIRAGALDLTVMYGGMFVYVLMLTGHPHEPRLWAYALAFGLAAAGSAGAFLFARPIPWADPRSMPQLVRLSFGAFAMILTGAGAALVVHAGIGALASYYLFASNATRIRYAFIGPESLPALDAADADLR